VFETRPVTQVGTGWIDTGRVSNPAALTGDPYSVSFTVSAGVTSYTVLRNGNPTALTNVPYASGKAIEIDGMSFTISGAPANGDAFAVEPSTASLNVFGAIDRAVAALQTPLQNNGQITQATMSGVRDMDAALGRLQEQRALAGETLNRIDGVENRLSSTKLSAQTDRSSAEDLDMVEAISRFQSQQSGYDAALKSYSMVQRMSLFQYLSG
jgi:flagellar hook-associated protein 3 FlgL